MSVSRAVALVDRTSSSSASSRSWKGGAAAGTGGGVGVGGHQVAKKQRAPNAKVKTGCQNCKIRRVKCDEGKPGCDKCFRYGILCSGYPAPARIYQATSRLLVPKAQDLAPVPTSSPPDLMVPVQQTGYLRTRHIHIGPNLDNIESRYFRFYVEDIAKQIAGPCGFGLWNVVIPQASDVQPFIGHAIVALGALSKSRIETNALKQFRHREYALAKHVEALAGMRKELQRDGYDSRIALIACLLVFCFESLQGNQAAASVHATGGVSLLERWNRERNLKGSIEPSGSVLEDDGLYYAVACLDFQAMAFVDQRPLEYHQKMSAEIDTYLLTMPSILNSRGQFKSLAEARHYGHKVMRKTFHFIYSAGIFFEAHQKNDFHSPGGDTDDSRSLSPDTKPLERFQIPQAMKDEQEFHMEGIRHWQVAATSVLKDSIRDPDSEECLLATLMQVHCTMTVITLAGCLFVDQSGYDDHIKDFEEILSLATSVWTRVTTKLGQFTFETGILPGLLEVGIHCRDHKIRKQTIDMLYTGTGYREGVWDSLAVANICNWVRNIEEEWMDDDGNIPSEMRATLTSINMLYQERRARVSVSQRTAPGEALREKEVTTMW